MPASPERLPTETATQSIEPSASTSSGPAPSSILAFLGGQPRPNPLSLNTDPAKRKRKNTEPTTQSHTQGRIVLNPAGGAAWAVEIDEVQPVELGDGKVANGRGKGKGRGKAKGGEEDEMKDMGKRAKAAQRGRGGKRGTGGKRKASGKEVGQLNLKAQNGDDDDDENDGDNPLLLTDRTGSQGDPKSPSKQKRGRPPKRKPAEAGPSRRGTRSISTKAGSPPIPYVRSSSPVDITVIGGSRNGNQENGTRRTKQPALSRANTASTSDLRGQTHKDAIDVEKTISPVKAGPRKLVFASDAKPAHSFFSRPAAVTNVDPPSEIAVPIVNSESGNVPEPKTVENPATVELPKKVHNFFHPARGETKSTTSKKGWGHGIQEGEEWSPPWPGADWPVHLGADMSTQAGPSRPRRLIPDLQPCDSDDDFWLSFTSQTKEPDDNAAHITNRAKPTPARNGDRETFCDRFRPKTASQVLGNVTEATYLRDWLSTLVVGTSDGNRPRVIRKVPKRKRRLDDWIVDDINEFGDDEVEEEAEMPEPYDEPDMPMGERPNSYAPLSAWLTNTILLSGPNGSGKSAAVYAAATELGWEVFEVYPGIGKRTGGNLMSLVGDVGKNHIVGKARDADHIKSSPAGLKTFFGAAAKEVDNEEAPPPGSQGEPIEIDDDHPEREATPPPRLRNPSIPTTPFRDEEVDILFDEEATFWPAVIALIADSKRPVVMTCNDPERVMLDAIPLQAILQFKPPPRQSVVTHLAYLCDQLGIERNQDYLNGLYDRSVIHPPQILQSPGPPNGNEWLPFFDLRKAIMQLQLERGVPIEKAPAAECRPQDFKTVVKRAEVNSYADAHLAERPWAVMELFEIDRYEPTPDDQLGVKTLLKPELSDHITTLPAYDRTSEISSVFLGDLVARPEPDDLFTNQVHYIRSLLPLLDPIIPLSSRLLPHPTLFTDYMPTIQNLVQVDDDREAYYNACRAAGEDVRNIKTGRPVRVTAWLSNDYTRALPLEEMALDLARKTLRYE